METREKIKKVLAQCYGTSKYIKHWMGTFVYTDGVQALTEMADCHWLLDAIGSYRKREPFQVWTLVVNDDNSAVLTMKEDSDLPHKVRQEIEYTDFPLGEIELWVEEGGYGTPDNWTKCLVLLLPSEH